MIPRRDEIEEKLQKLVGKTREEKYVAISEWLDTLGMPASITRFGHVVEPKQEILSDLESYEGY